MKKPQREDAGILCPLMKEDVTKVCHTCDWFVQLTGTNPNTGEPVKDWGCAVTYLLFASLSGAQMSRQTGAAVESFRNEMVRQNRVLFALADEGRGGGSLIGAGTAPPQGTGP